MELWIIFNNNVMQNDNRNRPSPIWKIFTLLGFLLGALLYIIVKQKKEKEEKPLEKEKSIIPKPKVLPKKVSKEEKVDLDLKELKLSVRQKSIVEKIMEKGKIYPSQLQELLPNVSTRTIRRDMNGLEKMGLV